MGGDAFPDTERLSRKEYDRKCQELGEVLTSLGLKYGFPAEVADKAEICQERGKKDPYGDIDVIIGLDDESRKDELVQTLTNVLGTSGCQNVKNSPTYSVLSPEKYQIDLMFCKEPNLDFIVAFKSNNDFGALLGHLLTPLKMKWTEEGLFLKLEVEKKEHLRDQMLLTIDLGEVCSVLGLPRYCLDGKTRLTSTEVFEVLTKSKVFFAADYDEKYKIRERRKERPVSDVFFTLLEQKSMTDLEAARRKMYENDEVEELFRKFKTKSIDYRQYVERLGECLGKREEVLRKLEALNESKKVQGLSNEKFNFQILCSWLPDLEHNTVGKVMGKLKSKHSGSGPRSFDEWIGSTDVKDIKLEVEHCKSLIIK